MKTTHLALVLGVLSATSVLAANADAIPTQYPSGTTIKQYPGVSPGYVIYQGPAGVGYAHDVHGNVVHTWSIPGETLGYLRPLNNGNVLVNLHLDTIVELDLSSNIVWQYTDGIHKLHHDQDRLPNGNTLMLCSKDFTDAAISALPITDDCVIEVDPAGNIVWEWQTADHFSQFGFDSDTLAGIAEGGGDWAHANAAAAIPTNTSHVDPRFAPGNIMMSYRNLNMMIIVDKESGDIVWSTNGLTIGQHNMQMITDNLPGGGNILVFDNGYRGKYSLTTSVYSRALELDPVTLQTMWDYDASKSGLDNWTFYSWFISSVQRLPNGNTFINEGANGRLFEVDTAGNIVWEFINPHVGVTAAGITSRRIYRAHKVAPGWAGGALASGGVVPPPQVPAQAPADPDFSLYGDEPIVRRPAFTPTEPQAKSGLACSTSAPGSNHRGVFSGFVLALGLLGASLSRRRRN